MRALLLVLVVLVFAVPARAASDTGKHDVQLAESVMQCMERCIRAEGTSEKDTCKSRCANVSTYGRPQRDCGAEYKACRNGCGKDKACVQGCRDARRNCF